MSTFRVPQPSVGSRGVSGLRAVEKKPYNLRKLSSCWSAQVQLLSPVNPTRCVCRPLPPTAPRPGGQSCLLPTHAGCWMLELLKLHDVDICKPSSLARTPQG